MDQRADLGCFLQVHRHSFDEKPVGAGSKPALVLFNNKNKSENISTN